MVARLLWEQEVFGSTPKYPTVFRLWFWQHERGVKMGEIADYFLDEVLEYMDWRSTVSEEELENEEI
jgi:hypothetical protein